MTAGDASINRWLHGLAQRELSIAGRYRLESPRVVPAKEPWWLRVWQWIADHWDAFWHAIFARLHVGRQAAAGIGDVLLAIVALLLIAVAVRLMMNVQRARSAPRQKSEPLQQSPSPQMLYQQASAAAAAADYDTATRLLFAAAIAALQRLGAIEFAPSATVGDLRRMLRAHDAVLAAAFDSVAVPFVQRAYAERSVTASQWSLAKNGYAALCHPEP